MTPPWPLKLCVQNPPAMSQTLTVLSADPVATSVEVGSMAITMIGASWAFRLRVSVPVRRSQVLSNRLLLALTRVLPSGVTAKVVMISVSPLSLQSFFPVLTSITSISSPTVVMRYCSS